MNLTGRFIIDGYDLYEAFKVVVQEAQGLDVLPKVKKRTEYDWPEESGVDVDATTDLTYEAHDITLDCYVQESTYADAVKRINGVVKLLSSDGFHLLGSQLRQRLYPVLLQEVAGYKRITPASASAVYVQFTLKLRCPKPETRIGNATVEASGQVTLVVPTGKDFTVWWGDGTVNENTLTHTYTEAGTYTVLIAGTGVTSVVITGINVAEFSYPATGDIIHVDVSHTSEEAWELASMVSGVDPVSETATFTLALSHLYKGIRCNSATDMDCNIPLNDTVAFPIRSVITIQQIGNGIVTVKAASGVTLNGDAKTAGQYKFIQLWKTDTNVWNVIGGVS